MNEPTKHEPQRDDPMRRGPECPFDEELVDAALADAFGPDPPASSAAEVATSVGPGVLRSLEGASQFRARIALREPAPAPDQSGLILKSPGATAAEPPLAVGKYQLLGEVARGGIGVVWKGHDVDLGRPVALKFLLDGHRGDPSLVQRFVEEAQVGGQLQHPGIVPVYDLGVENGRPFIAMKLIQGKTLAALLSERQEPIHDRRRFLQIFEQVCQTMAYAHARGVIHRDLKPSNIMAGAFGEVQVMDWGFAKVIGQGGVADEKRAERTWSSGERSGEDAISTVRSLQQGSKSLAGSVMGTPAYMPPEQARGEVDHMDERADVFSLGAILCEVLTGRPPYVGGTPADLIELAAACRTEEARACLETCGADRELVELTLSCLRSVPAERPRNAGGVAASIGSYLAALEKKAEHARISEAEAKVKAASARKAQRLTIALSAAVIAAVLIAAGGYLWIESDRAARAGEASLAVHRALGAAERWRGEARSAAGEDLVSWTQALASARQAGELAATPAISSDLREQASSLLGTIQVEEGEARERVRRHAVDRSMIEKVENIAIPEGVKLRDTRAEEREARHKCTAYASAFRDHGIDVESGDDAAIAASLRSSAIAVTLATAIDDWALASKALPAGDAQDWKRLLRLAGEADTDPLRRRLRGVFLSETTEGNGEEIRRRTLDGIVADVSLPALPPLTISLLAKALFDAGSEDAAVSLLRNGETLHPGDFNVHFELGLALERKDPPDEEEAAQAYSAAVALRPGNLHARHLLGVAIGNGKTPERANAIFQAILEADPGFAMAHCNLGVVLGKAGRVEEAMAEYREAIHLDLNVAAAHNNLGNHLGGLRRVEEALKCFDEAIRIEPENAGYHVNRGNALLSLGRSKDAAAEYSMAIRLAPGLAMAHSNLGTILQAEGRLDEAIGLYRESIRLDPPNSLAHLNLAMALRANGLPREAAVEFREVVRLAPGRTDARNDLGVLLAQLGDLEGAVRELEENVRLRPEDPHSWWSLGRYLRDLGKHKRALEALERASQISTRESSEAAPHQEWLLKEERFLAQRGEDTRAIIEERAQPANAEEALTVARIAAAEQRHAASARLYAKAFQLEPTWLDDMASRHRANAACEAAQAGAGRGKDAEGISGEAQRDELRQALAWLRGDLDAIRRLSSPETRDTTRESLRFLATDDSLACVRDTEALARLPDAEREAFQKLWAEVTALLKK